MQLLRERSFAHTMPEGRIDALDALRGFALFGIFVVNLEWFANPVYALGAGRAYAGLDAAAAWVVAFAFQAKFFVLFSFLFGYGLAVQLAGAEGRGEALGPRYARRLGGLLAFGVLHATCLFVGDILVSYALLGAALWALRAWSPGRLARFAAGLVGAAVLAHAALALGAAPDAAAAADFARRADEARRHYLGSFADAAGQRVRDLALVAVFTPLFNWPTAMAMFALGLGAGRARVVAELPRHLPPLRRLLPWALALGVAGNAAYATFADSASAAPALAAASFVGLAVSAPALSFVYAMAVVRAARSPRLARYMEPLRAAGRMSLTNYLAQAVVASLLFNGYGLGWYGRVGPAALLVVAAVVFGGQLALSSWWLARFRFGPDEWLLRCWTYGRWEPIRRGARG